MTDNFMLKPAGPPVPDLLARFSVAKTLRQPMESVWRECMDYTLPLRNSSNTNKLFDGTAADAVDQLASNLLAQLTPPFSSWIGLTPGPLASKAQAKELAPILQSVNDILQGHFDRSNFAVEMHQAFLDLVTMGTACLQFNEAEPGALTAFQFSAMPLTSMYFLDTTQGQLNAAFCIMELSHAELLERFPHIQSELTGSFDAAHKHRLLYVATPLPQGGTILSFILDSERGEQILLEQVKSMTSPFIAFRWQKAAGDLYGRSPVMKTLPDIKTANKVVELILKNASLAVTGIWLADDDGVLNPANIKLTPGTIIPKAVGSAGLTPLKMPGNFDVSQLVLQDLRQKINHALLGDRIGNMSDRSRTATEILARQQDVAQLLGATYGRLQGELLTPLALRALDILKARGEIPDLHVDGRIIALDYRSPLARAQAQRDVQATLSWLQTASAQGAQGLATLNMPATLHYLARALGVPLHLLQENNPQATEVNA